MESNAPRLTRLCRRHGLDERRYRLDGLLDRGRRFALHRYSPGGAAGGCVLFLHGYLDHALHNARLLSLFTDLGLEVIAPDLPGHGLSEGSRGWIGDFSEYGRLVELAAGLARTEVGDRPVFAVGHSTGGAALIEYLQTQPVRFRNVVLINPLIRSALWRLSVLAAEMAPPRLKRLYRAGIADPLQGRVVDLGWFRALRLWNRRLTDRAPLPDGIWVVQSTNDLVLDWRYNLDVLRRLFPNLRLHLMPRAGHDIVNERPVHFLGLEKVLRQALCVPSDLCYSDGRE